MLLRQNSGATYRRAPVAATFTNSRQVSHIRMEPPHTLERVRRRNPYGLNSVFSFFFTATPLIFTYAGSPSLYGG